AVSSHRVRGAGAERTRERIGGPPPAAPTPPDGAWGTGKPREHLARWYEVQGLDLNEDFVAIARDRLGGRAHIHLADMTSFDLARTFDAVTCLFSSIAYVLTEERLDAALTAMSRHLKPGATPILRPWISPDAWIPSRPHLLTVDEPELKIARTSVAGREGDVSVLEFDYLVATPDGTRHFTERHEAALFTASQYRAAFERAGLGVELD